jgi:uncharacterized protein with FMN-binding domain
VRRPAAALLGTLAGTVLLVGAKYGSASPAANAGDTVAASDAGTTGAAGGMPGDPSAGPAGSAGSAAQNPGAAPGPSGKNPTTGAAPGTGNPTPGRTTGGPAAATTTAAAPACTTKSGPASTIASPGVGTITVTIQVCGGVLKTATAAQSRSNWDKNTAALPALNSLAVANYKTNFSAIHYSGATLTSNAYQASLRSAMTRAGI